MDPLTLTILIALPGLLSAYKGEGRNRKMDDFMQWLKENNHTGFVEVMQNQVQLQSHIKDIIEGNHSDVMDSLKDIQVMMAEVLSNFKGFTWVKETAPEEFFSEQAIDIFKQFYENRLHSSTLCRTYDGAELNGIRTPKGREQNFLEDDLNYLVGAGLLRESDSKRGERVFYPTRVGESYYQKLSGQSE
ncbi:hypothetical protein [Limisalsivibrio acetivorans]|uniref:hypothetical protein n=1 Tax=Limisalsivibrio acetivorans TaxID=1304888 RepID=UPI0003B64E1A|nr:hypothetical protein [Limisalsivibrio acetivorans]